MNSGSPVLYCYRGVDRASLEGLQRIWSGLNVKLYEFEKLIIVVGNSTENTEKALEAEYDIKDKEFKIELSPYINQCVGLKSVNEDDTNVTLDVKSQVVLRLPILLVVGLFLFYAAHTLSRWVWQGVWSWCFSRFAYYGHWQKL